jgi:hypothetical protein
MNAIRAIHPYRHEGLWVLAEIGIQLSAVRCQRRHPESREPKSGCQVCFPHGPFWPRVGRALMADGILDQLAAGIPGAS